ncbi:MAG: hypothetical protein PVF27_03260, partial [Gemmatimonadales bacterium]
SGGSGYYTYQWYNDGLFVGDDRWYTGGKNPGNLTDHFSLRVVVSDGADGYGSETITVYEVPSAPICMQ